MEKLLFPLLKAEDIEVRIGNFNKEKSKCTLLLYKTARTDAKYLDQVVGCYNWQKKYYELNGVIYCSLGIYDNEKHEWVWKDDAGAETQVEKEKGTASDSFKRAGFAWGLGRELYSSPTIWLDNPNRYSDLEVSFIDYNEDRSIKSVVIIGKDKENGYAVVQLYPKTKNVSQNVQKDTNKGTFNTSDIKVGDDFTKECITKEQLDAINTFYERLSDSSKERFMQTILSDKYNVPNATFLTKDQAQEIITKYIKRG